MVNATPGQNGSGHRSGAGLPPRGTWTPRRINRRAEGMALLNSVKADPGTTPRQRGRHSTLDISTGTAVGARIRPLRSPAPRLGGRARGCLARPRHQSSSNRAEGEDSYRRRTRGRRKSASHPRVFNSHAHGDWPRIDDAKARIHYCRDQLRPSWSMFSRVRSGPRFTVDQADALRDGAATSSGYRAGIRRKRLEKAALKQQARHRRRSDSVLCSRCEGKPPNPLIIRQCGRGGMPARRARRPRRRRSS